MFNSHNKENKVHPHFPVSPYLRSPKSPFTHVPGNRPGKYQQEDGGSAGRKAESESVCRDAGSDRQLAGDFP